MNRWKNKGLWISLAALIPLVLKGFNIDVLPSNYDDIVNAVLSALVLAGVLNNPTDGTGFLDTKTETVKDITNDIKQ